MLTIKPNGDRRLKEYIHCWWHRGFSLSIKQLSIVLKRVKIAHVL